MMEAAFRVEAVPQFSAGPSEGPTAASGIRQRRRNSDAAGDAKRRAGRPRFPSPAARSGPRRSKIEQVERRSEVSSTPAGPGALTPPGPLIRLVSKTPYKTGAWTLLRVLECGLPKAGVVLLRRPEGGCFFELLAAPDARTSVDSSCLVSTELRVARDPRSRWGIE